MPAKKKTAKKTKRAANPALRQVEQLRKTVKVLKMKLERETKARRIEARIKSEAEKASARLTTQLKALRDQGKKIASELKSALGDANRRDAARKEALSRIADLKARYDKTSAGLKAELAQKTSDLRHKSEELMKLAGQSAHRAAEIIRGHEHHEAAEPTAGSSESSSYTSAEPSLPEDHGEGPPGDKGPDEER